MSTKQPPLSRLFSPTTDIPALIVIVLGVVITVSVDDTPIRLIGICIVLLGIVGIVVLYHQRMTDVQPLQGYAANKPVGKTVSEITDFKTTLKQDSTSKRLVFDDFAESFGDTDYTQQQDAVESPPPVKAPSGLTSSTVLVFDDFDDTVSFNDTTPVSLTVAPEKFTPLQTSAQTGRSIAGSSDVGTTSAPQKGAQASGKNVLVFDDTDESVAEHNEFTPTIRIGQTTLPENVQRSSVPPPKTPPPPPLVLGKITPGSYTPPKLDTTLVGASFTDDEGEEFRIVGTSPSSTPSLTQQESTTKQLAGSQQDVERENSQIAGNQVQGAVRHQESQRTEQDADKDDKSVSLSSALEYTPAVLEATSEPQELAAEEGIQDKVTRAAKAAVKREYVETSVPPAASQDIQHGSTPLPPEHVSHRRKKLTIQMTDIAEDAPEAAKHEPRREFEYLLQRILLAIRSSMNARTAAFWWYAADRKCLTLEAKISDISQNVQRTVVLAEVSPDSVFTHITETGSPEILSEISNEAELELLPYYTAPSRTRSFVGVPVYFDKAVVGVLMADSTEDDAYDNATVSFLGHFTKLIAGLIQSYTEKYDLLQSARTLEAIDTFRQLTLKPERTSEDICTALIRSLMRLVPYTTIGTCIYSEERSGWYVSNLHTKEPLAREILGGEVHLEDSLVGRAITQGRTYRFANPPANCVRVTECEQKPLKLAFTVVPLISVSRCYGALFIEELGETQLTNQDVEIIETVAEYAGTTLEQMQLQDYVQAHALLQDSTDEALVSLSDM
ncbi:MAG: GAF domain-containing protein, partial [Bacteroidota bacterium]|nr:GAF domain-containing protein [Candidatus Kapabacteria bacterium]MDW8220781.1 GAF domain-containing protein [Bacteroidota bacterium]